VPAIVLIPSPFLGPASWQAVAEELRRLGNQVVVADLDQGAMRPGWEGHVSAVSYALSAIDVPPIVCVAHSGAGPLAPAIEASVRMPLRWVFVDAAPPHPGKSRWEALPAALRDALPEPEDGFLPPWHRWFSPGTLEGLIPEARVRRALFDQMSEVPMALMEEPMPDTADWPTHPGAYLQLSDAYRGAATLAAGHGWAVERIAGNHLLLVTEPGRVAAAINSLARDLTS
jgi:hypothetical protein